MRAKYRVKFTVCTNTDRSHVLPPILIGNSKRPVLFALSKASDKFDYLYLTQSNSWMTTTFYEYFIVKIWHPPVGKRTSDKLAMIMDNFATHGDPLLEQKDETYIFIPPKVKSFYNPMGMGIIASMKRFSLLNLLHQ